MMIMRKCRRAILQPLLVRHVGVEQRRSLVVNLQDGAKTSIRTILDPETQKHYEGKSLQVSGFVQTVRKQKKVAFVTIKDGSSFQTLQAVLRPEDGKESVPPTRKDCAFANGKQPICWASGNSDWRAGGLPSGCSADT